MLASQSEPGCSRNEIEFLTTLMKILVNCGYTMGILENIMETTMVYWGDMGILPLFRV